MRLASTSVALDKGLPALLKKQASMQAEVDKIQQTLAGKTAELKEVTRQIRAINGAVKRASTVTKTGGKETLSVNGKSFALTDSAAAVKEGKDSGKSTYYIGKDGSKKLLLSKMGFRGGAKNYRSGYGYTSAKTYADFGKIVKAMKVGFLSKFV
jgi:DNA-binding FrmR family transcriptional regulator